MNKLYSHILLLLSIPCILFARDTVRVGTFMLRPFMMEGQDKRQTAGVAVDFWEKYVAPEMDVDIDASGPFPIMRTQKMLEDGDIDVICNMTKIPEREEKFIFSAQPLSEIAISIVVLKESRLKKVTCRDDLYNLRVVSLEKTFIPPLLASEKIKIELVSGADFFQRFIEMLEAGHADAFLHINNYSLRYELAQFGKTDSYRIIALPVDKVKVYCVFTKSERGLMLSKKFDAVNRSLFKARVYDSLAEETIK